MSLLKSSSGGATGLLGSQQAPRNMGYAAKLILTPDDAEFDTKILALTESEWLDKINSIDGARYIVLPIFHELESSPEDDLFATSSIGSVAFIREGKDTVKYSVIVSPLVMSQLRTLNGIDWKAYEVTSEGFIKGTSQDDIVFSPFSIDSFRVGKEVKATGDAPALVPISITYSNPGEWADRPAFVEPLKEGLPTAWNPRDLNDPKALDTVVTNPSTTGFDIAIAGYDNVPFQGAVAADVLIKDKATGTAIAVSTITETTKGMYTVQATIPAGTYLIGFATVGTAGATQGYAGLERDLNEIVIS
jgi:hypothetical protein